jgi:hypothetical protein
MPGAIVEITCIADGVGFVPAKSNGTLPATLRDFWARWLVDHALILPRLGFQYLCKKSSAIKIDNELTNTEQSAMPNKQPMATELMIW